MNNLSALEQETINEFVGIVGISLDSEETEQSAIRLLSHHNYNLNNSVLAFFETGLEVSTPQATRAFPVDLDSANLQSNFSPIESNPLRSLQNEYGLELLLPKLAKAPKISNKWQFDLGIHMSRRAFPKNEKSELGEAKEEKSRPSFWWLLVLVFPKALSMMYSAFRYFFGLDLILNPKRSAVKEEFDYDAYDENDSIGERIGDANELYNLVFNDFNASHGTASREYNFLLVLLVDNDTELFLNKFFQQPLVKEMLHKSTGDFKDTQIFVNNMDKSPEAYEVSTTYRIKKTPFVALLGNVSRDPTIMSSMSVIYKANCSLGDEEEVNTLLSKLSKSLQRHLIDYNPQLVTKRFDKQEIEFSRLIKEKQDAAYVESLNSDKMKRLEKQNLLQEQQLQIQLKKSRDQFILNLVRTGYFQNRIKDASANDVVRISIKLPNGKRIVHKFHKDSHMCEIYLFVESQLLDGLEEMEDDTTVQEMSFADFINTYTFPFELFKPFPKCTLPALLTTIKEFGKLASGDNILFEYEDEEIVHEV